MASARAASNHSNEEIAVNVLPAFSNANGRAVRVDLSSTKEKPRRRFTHRRGKIAQSNYADRATRQFAPELSLAEVAAGFRAALLTPPMAGRRTRSPVM